VASRAFKPGDIVMKEFPLASAPGPLSEHVCFGCHRHFIKAYICCDCRSPLCGRDCQVSAEHQKECRYLTKIIPEIESRQKNGNKIQRVPVQLSMLMLPLRLLLLRNEEPDKWNQLMDLESHMAARQTTSIWGFNQRNIAPFLEMMLIDEMPDINDKLVQQICGAVDVNSFGFNEIAFPNYLYIIHLFVILLFVIFLEIRIETFDRRQHDVPQQPISNCKSFLCGFQFFLNLDGLQDII
jgi:hypothetical protein